MNIREISSEDFNEFAKTHILKNFYQTANYGELMKHSDYKVMYVGGFKKEVLVAASLILHKPIGLSMRYGYAPRGFLIDYSNSDLVIEFTKKLKDYLYKKKFAFVKINPELTLSQVNFNEKSKVVNSEVKAIINNLKENGYDKLRDNLYFESILPKFTPIIYLPAFDYDSIDEKTIDTINKNSLGGIKLINGTEEDIKTFYSFINKSEQKTETYYKFLYKAFKKDDMIDLLLCEIDYDLFIQYLQKEYVNEQEKNERINSEFRQNPQSNDLYEQKLKSDQTISRITSEIAKFNERIQEDNNMKEILGGAMIIKYQGRVTILTVGCTKDYKSLDIRSYIYYKIIDEYKKAGYSYLDLNGITGDFTDTNPYRKLNEFKLKFKPKVYEFVGEFDLIVNKPMHQWLWTTNQIQKEFYKPAVKK